MAGGAQSKERSRSTVNPWTAATISFVSTSGPTGGGNAGGPIQGGKYSVRSNLTPGTYKVEINWLKSTGKTIPNKSDSGTTQDETKQMISMEYNKTTKLTAEIKSGSNTANFELKSGGAIDNTPIGAPPPKSKAAGDP